MEKKLIAEGAVERQRLDQYLALRIGSLSRSAIKNRIAEGSILVNGKEVSPSYVPKDGDEITLLFEDEKEDTEVKGEDIPLDIIYEDDCLLVINKKRGMVTHPAPGNMSGTLVNALLGKSIKLSEYNGDPLRPGIVHRLDRLTTGLILVAKDEKAHESLQKQIQEKTAHRIYEGLCFGNIKSDAGIIINKIGRSSKDRKKMAVLSEGREAITEYRVLERFGKYTLAEMSLKTGRTHQIRVQFADMGYPIVGDEVYTKRKSDFKTQGQLLHAGKIEFVHPVTGEKMEFGCPLPEDFESILNKLRRMQK